MHISEHYIRHQDNLLIIISNAQVSASVPTTFRKEIQDILNKASSNAIGTYLGCSIVEAEDESGTWD